MRRHPTLKPFYWDTYRQLDFGCFVDTIVKKRYRFKGGHQDRFAMAINDTIPSYIKRRQYNRKKNDDPKVYVTNKDTHYTIWIDDTAIAERVVSTKDSHQMNAFLAEIFDLIYD